MQYKKAREQPEHREQERLRKYMATRGWYTKKLHGGKYQSGLPDLLAMHCIHGIKWIEMKVPGEKLRASQIAEFARFEKCGQEVYILESIEHYRRIFKPKGNWKEYVRL